jgi:enoyl-CoA hydratase
VSRVRAREPLRLERDGDVAIWTLARPAARNALDRETFAALERALAAAASDVLLRAVVLTGEGSTFCSGGDLREFREATTREQAGELADSGRRVCAGLAGLRVPVIAALSGPAIGGGAELAMACDLRVADPGATLCFRHAHMGVTTAWGILPKLIGTVGTATASRLLLTGVTLDAHEALRLGLVDEVVAGGCVAGALSWCSDVAKGSPQALAELKGLIRDASSSNDERLQARERERFIDTWTGADHREAMDAFFEGRAPQWERDRPERKL